MSLFDLADTIIALTEGVVHPATVSADLIELKRADTVAAAIRLGFPADLAGQVADEAWQTLSAFADALRAAGQAAHAVNDLGARHLEELQALVGSD